jgi:hypothetical protein
MSEPLIFTTETLICLYLKDRNSRLCVPNTRSPVDCEDHSHDGRLWNMTATPPLSNFEGAITDDGSLETSHINAL